MDKLTETVSVKLTEDMALAVNRLAAIEGMSAPELIRKLIDCHLDKKHHEFMVLKRVFEGKEFRGSKES